MRTTAHLLLPVLLLLTSTPATAAEADVVYVTDELRLGLYRTEETSGRTVKTLISGARLTVLERALMSIRVRTEDGDEGWVKTAYIVETEPARSRLGRLEAAVETAGARLEEAEQALEASRSEANELASQLAVAEQNITNLPALEAENAALRETLASSGIRMPLGWFIVAALVCLMAGGFTGYWLLDRRVRSRFGGIRPY